MWRATSEPGARVCVSVSRLGSMDRLSIHATCFYLGEKAANLAERWGLGKLSNNLDSRFRAGSGTDSSAIARVLPRSPFVTMPFPCFCGLLAAAVAFSPCVGPSLLLPSDLAPFRLFYCILTPRWRSRLGDE